MFQQYFRLSREQFSQVLFLIGDTLIKDNRIRDVISPRERLAVCLRICCRLTPSPFSLAKGPLSDPISSPWPRGHPLTPSLLYLAKGPSSDPISLLPGQGATV
ncbi:hypothetical protein ACOMHN_031195 [Nucella lapillus]